MVSVEIYVDGGGVFFCLNFILFYFILFPRDEQQVIVLPLGAFLHLLVRALKFFCMQGTFA